MYFSPGVQTLQGQLVHIVTFISLQRPWCRGFKWFTLRPIDLVGQSSMFKCTEMTSLGQISQENPWSWEIILHCCAQLLNWGPAKLGVFSYNEQKWQPGVCWPEQSQWTSWDGPEWGVDAMGKGWSQDCGPLSEEPSYGGRAEVGLGEKGGVFTFLLKIGNSRACLIW